VRIFFMLTALIMVAGIALLAWLTTRTPSLAESERIAAVLQSDAPANEPSAYAHCASCHLHDGSGRPDGSIPRLAGQRRAVIEAQLHRLRAGIVHLPVMQAFARTLEPEEVSQVAAYLSALPATWEAPNHALTDTHLGAPLYAEHCASCHGANGEGHDGLFAPRLCGQYATYLDRRLDEIAAHRRGDADAIMVAALKPVPTEDLHPIVAFLASGKGCPTEALPEDAVP
jgi:cytochrome c553